MCCFCVLGVGSGVKVCGKNVYYALATALAAKSTVNLTLSLSHSIAHFANNKVRVKVKVAHEGFNVRPSVTKYQQQQQLTLVCPSVEVSSNIRKILAEISEASKCL